MISVTISEAIGLLASRVDADATLTDADRALAAEVIDTCDALIASPDASDLDARSAGSEALAKCRGWLGLACSRIVTATVAASLAMHYDRLAHEDLREFGRGMSIASVSA